MEREKVIEEKLDTANSSNKASALSKFFSVFVPVLFGVILFYYSQEDNSKFSKLQLDVLRKIQEEAREAGLPDYEIHKILEYDEEICYTGDCLTSAMEAFLFTNFTADPCTNWLEFACGNRKIKNAPVDNSLLLTLTVRENTKDILKMDHDHRFGNISQNFLLKEAQTYFHQCVNREVNDEEDVKEILSFLEGRYGGWPMVTNKPPRPIFNWLDMVADLNQIDDKVLFSPPLLQIKVSTKRQNNTLELTTGLIWEWSKSYFIKFMKKLNPELEELERQYEIMVKFIDAVNKKITLNGTDITTLEDFQSLTDNYLFQYKSSKDAIRIDWAKFFNRALEGSEIDLNLFQIEFNFVSLMSTIETIQEFINNGEISTVSNILHFQFAEFLLRESTILLDDLHSSNYKNSSEKVHREEICYDNVTSIFGYSLGKTYLSIYYDDAKTRAVEEMMTNIRNTYINVTRNISWMADSTKQNILDKLEAISYVIAEPEWTRTKRPELLKDFYKSLNISAERNSSYSMNYLNASRWMTAKWRNWLYHLNPNVENGYWHNFTSCSSNDLYWSGYLIIANACVRWDTLQAVISAGVLQSPFYNIGNPGFSTYGSLGNTIAHEIGHLFDTHGRFYDSKGNYGEFWDKNTVSVYQEWYVSLWKDYRNAMIQITNQRMENDVYLTADEDIADNLGLLFSYLSYKEYLNKLRSEGRSELKLPGLSNRLSPEQLFFMKFSSDHCNRKRFSEPGIWNRKHSAGDIRAVVPIQRSKFFAKAFNCTLPQINFSRMLNV